MSIGGVETFLLRLGKYLQSRGCEVDIVTTEGTGPWIHKIHEAGLRGKDISGLWIGEWTRLWSTALEVSRANYDVVFLNHARYAQAVMARWSDQTAIVPIVHNDTQAIYRVATANADAWNVAVCVSPRLWNKVKMMVPRRPSVCIPNGVELPDVRRIEMRRDGGGRIRLAYVGRLTQAHKNVLVLPDILRNCRDRGINAELVVVGAGEDEKALRSRLRALSVEDAVTMTGPLSTDAVYDVLLASDVLLLPSFHEGLPIVLLEAMACGCIPIASRIEGITDEVVEDGVEGYLVDVQNVNGFSDAIIGLAGNSPLRRQMGCLARHKVETSFSVDIMGAQYWALIQDLTEGRYRLPRTRRTAWLDLSLLLTWKDCLPPLCRAQLRGLKKTVHNYRKSSIKAKVS